MHVYSYAGEAVCFQACQAACLALAVHNPINMASGVQVCRNSCECCCTAGYDCTSMAALPPSGSCFSPSSQCTGLLNMTVPVNPSGAVSHRFLLNNKITLDPPAHISDLLGSSSFMELERANR
jgi:hypothetical protein